MEKMRKEMKYTVSLPSVRVHKRIKKYVVHIKHIQTYINNVRDLRGPTVSLVCMSFLSGRTVKKS